MITHVKSIQFQEELGDKCYTWT